MKGFVRNEGDRGGFILQRRLYPGAQISLDDAYLVVGKKSGKKEGPAFVKWLRENHLSDDRWAFYKEEGVPYFAKKEENAAPAAPAKRVAPGKGAGKVMRRKTDNIRKASITAKDIIDPAYEEARVLIEKCSDKLVLKKALALSRHFSHKEQHMRHVLKRLEQVY